MILRSEVSRGNTVFGDTRSLHGCKPEGKERFAIATVGRQLIPARGLDQIEPDPQTLGIELADERHRRDTSQPRARAG